MWTRILIIAALAAGVIYLGSRDIFAVAAGTLDRPSIAVPAIGPDGAADPTVSRMRKTLQDHTTLFSGGSFVNAHSTLNFRGTAKELSTMLHELSEIDGAEISIRFSQGADILRPKVASEEESIDESSPWSIDHNGWANPQHLSVTIYLGHGAMKLDELQLPTIRGKMPKDATPTP
jgi:hypothetical protein